MATTRLEELFAWRDRDRQRKVEATWLIRGRELETELSPHGLMRWYLHPKIERTVIQSLLVYTQEIPPGSRTGKMKFQGNGWLFVLEGRGYSIVNGEHVDWEANDLVMLPNPPEGCTYQSFNLDREKPARFVAASPNLLHTLGPDMGSGFEQLEPAPEWDGLWTPPPASMQAKKNDASGAFRPKKTPRIELVEAARRAADPTLTNYEKLMEYYRQHVERNRTARKVQWGKELRWTHHRHAIVKYYLGFWIDDTALSDWLVFVQAIKTNNGKHRHQGGLALFILEGEGYTVVNGERHNWEAGDLVLLPILPEQCEHQHFNRGDPDHPAKFLAIIYLPFMRMTGGEFVQVENRPGFEQALAAGLAGDRWEL